MSTETAAEGTRLDAATREIRSVPVSRMFVDPSYQRHLNPRRAREIADNFSWSALGYPTLSRREDGMYAEVDGQHRIEALRLLGHGDAEVDSEVFEDLTPAEEAALFRDRNNMEKVPAIDKFRARLVAGEPKALAMMRILDRHGWKLQAGAGSVGYFSAISKLEKVFNSSDVAAERTLAVLTRAWGHDPVGVAGVLVEGLGRVFIRYGDEVQLDALVERLAQFPGGAAQVIGAGRGLRQIIGGTVGRAVGEKIIDIYNVRRKTTALPSLRSPRNFSQVEESE